MTNTAKNTPAVIDADAPVSTLDLKQFRHLDADALNNVVSFDEAVQETGLNEAELTYVSSPYVVLTDRQKDRLIGVPFLIRSTRFSTDPKTFRDYAVLYVVTKDNEMYILTDGSTGIFSQVQKIVADRLAAGHARPLEGILVANGLRVSEYDVNEDGKPAQPGERVVSTGATYYLA